MPSPALVEAKLPMQSMEYLQSGLQILINCVTLLALLWHAVGMGV